MGARQTALPIAADRQGIAVRILRVAAEGWRRWNNRRAARRLNEFTDWELRDIGLERQDLLMAEREPLFGDPTLRLQQMARARARAELTPRGP